MGTRTIVTTLDDLSGEEGASPIRFAYAGEVLEIDLGEDNMALFEEVMKPFAEKARKVGRLPTMLAGPTRAASGITASGVDNSAVRLWAITQGLPVSARGRIGSEIIDAYKARNNPKPQAPRTEPAIVAPTPKAPTTGNSAPMAKPGPNPAVLHGVTGAESTTAGLTPVRKAPAKKAAATKAPAAKRAPAKKAATPRGPKS